MRYKSTAVEGWTSLAEYRDRMKKDQKAIYYITGGREAGLRSSPLLETYKARGIEVLVMDDEIDEIVASAIGTFMEIGAEGGQPLRHGGRPEDGGGRGQGGGHRAAGAEGEEGPGRRR